MTPTRFARRRAVAPLSAQATDVGVNRVMARLFPAARTPAAMLALGPDRLKGFIRTIGLFNTKAETVRCRPSGVREAAAAA